MKPFLFGLLGSIAVISTAFLIDAQKENLELKKEARISHEIIKACEADRIRLLNDR